MAKSNDLRMLAVLAALAVAIIAAVMAARAPASAATPTDTLKQPPFAPTDVGLLDTAAYPEGPPMVPASSGPTDEATLRQNLSNLLNERFGSGSKQVKQGLSLFDAASTKQIVPDPRLRAALVALKGTAGEAAIAGVLDGTYFTVRFGTTADGTIAQVLPPPPGSDKPEIVFNQKFQYEDFRLLASTMAHEPLHRDPTVSNKEELAANAMDTLIYAQFLLESPELATSGTELARSKNTELLARINTRDTAGNLRLFTSQGNIFPSGTFVPYFAAPFEPLGDSTPGNKVLKGELAKVVGKVPKKVNFNDKTVLLLDSRQRVFTPAEVVQLAEILKLDTSPPSAAEAQRVQQEAEASDRAVPSWEEIFGAQ